MEEQIGRVASTLDSRQYKVVEPYELNEKGENRNHLPNDGFPLPPSFGIHDRKKPMNATPEPNRNRRSTCLQLIAIASAIWALASTISCNSSVGNIKETISEVEQRRLLNHVQGAYNTNDGPRFLMLLHPNSDIRTSAQEEVPNLSEYLYTLHNQRGRMRGYKIVGYESDSGKLFVDFDYTIQGIGDGYVKFQKYEEEWYIFAIDLN